MVINIISVISWWSSECHLNDAFLSSGVKFLPNLNVEAWIVNIYVLTTPI